MNNYSGKSSMIALVGVYLEYLAYGLLQNLINHEASFPDWLQIIFILFFTGTGIFLLFYAWKVWKKGREDQNENPVDIETQEEEAKSEEQDPEK